ncbi:hypothetical protein FIBSPDRAFT_905489, partial [Athelia psychrophila]
FYTRHPYQSTQSFLRRTGTSPSDGPKASPWWGWQVVGDQWSVDRAPFETVNFRSTQYFVRSLVFGLQSSRLWAGLRALYLAISPNGGGGESFYLSRADSIGKNPLFRQGAVCTITSPPKYGRLWQLVPVLSISGPSTTIIATIGSDRLYPAQIYIFQRRRWTTCGQNYISSMQQMKTAIRHAIQNPTRSLALNLQAGDYSSAFALF